MTATTKYKYHAIIVAAGTGERCSTHSNTPKQYTNLLGKPVLNHSIETFQNCTSTDSITVVINKDHKDLYRQALKKLQGTNKLQQPVIGGKTRKDSVLNALQSLNHGHDSDIILIHDAARPALTKNALNNIIQSFETTHIKAATLAHKNVNTLVRSEGSTCGTTIDRENVWSIQTPQAFCHKTIMSAHKQFAHDDSFTDDAALITACGEQVHLIENTHENIKLTQQADFITLEKTMKSTEEYVTITGQGFDVHAFDNDAEADSIRIGGIDIPHFKPLKAHSDGDVVLHTICDAIYGALSNGDIGHHFPPNDDKNKNRNSIDFIKHALSLVNQEDAEILHLDTTIIGEKPKIGPHRDQMRQKIAELLEVPISRIAVKATTTEKLGFTGRQEGLACQAVINIHRKKKHLC